MEKPCPETKTALDWNKCVRWVESTYKKDWRNWYGQARGEGRPADCRHALLKVHDWLRNGCYLDLSRTPDEFHRWPEHLREFHGMLFEQFGEYASPDGRLTFWVWW